MDACENTVNIMTDTGMDPIMQHMDGLIHMLMPTPGPIEGSYLGCRVEAIQIREALRNRAVQAYLLESPTIVAMVACLNSKEADWLRISTLDANLTYFGAYTLQDDEHVCGIHERGLLLGRLRFALRWQYTTKDWLSQCFQCNDIRPWMLLARRSRTH